MSEMILSTKPEGGHGDRRPKLRWLGDVQAEIITLGIKRWSLKAQE
jgi:hypothetical protein